MIKNNKWKIIGSSIIILLPIVFGLIFWNKLPSKIITHYGIDGQPDGSGSRMFFIVLPLILLITHLICIFFTAKDINNKNQNNKVMGMVLWICPIISLFVNGIVYSASFVNEPNVSGFTCLLMGLMFILIGNYLPKTKQNYTIGIKVKWALENEENWNATHRLGGKVWFVGGFVLLVTTFLPENIALIAMFVILMILVIIPVVYSYKYYKKQVKEGTTTTSSLSRNKSNKTIVIVSIIISVLLSVFCCLMMILGDINIKYGKESFTLEASFWFDSTIKYDDIESIEYRDEDNKGTRTNGLGSARLLAGAFKNEEFGGYTRYSYTKCNACVVLTTKEDKIIVISGIDSKDTKKIYENLKANIE